jgi:hypothetical protein
MTTQLQSTTTTATNDYDRTTTTTTMVGVPMLNTKWDIVQIRCKYPKVSFISGFYTNHCLTTATAACCCLALYGKG